MPSKATLRLALLGALIVVLGLGAIAGLVVSREDGVRLKPEDQEVVSLGKEIYDNYCALCHGKNLEGQPDWRRPGPDGRFPAPPHDDSGHTWHHPDKVLFEMVKFGPQKFAGRNYQSNMPPFENVLDDKEILAVLSFIKSRWSKTVRRRHSRIDEASREPRS